MPTRADEARMDRAVHRDRRYRAARDFACEIIRLDYEKGDAEWVAKRAIAMADALLDELAATEGPQHA
jgi:hypothetical protein